MAKLTRVTGKVFGATASPTGDINNGAYIGQFGSAQAGTFNGIDDVATIQALPAWNNGWIDAVVETDRLPALPERTGVDKVLSYQGCYLLQRGVAEWDSATDYYTNCYCSYDGVIYKSLTDSNINNQPDVSPANWEVYGQSSTAFTKFEINKGSTTLLTASSTVLSFDVDLSNPLTFTNISGNTRTVTSLDSINVTGVADGTYKIVLPNSGTTPILYIGTIFIQEDEPTTQVTNDVWINPQELYTVQQYDGANWQDFNDVILLDSSVTVSSGVISSLTQPTYNYNGIGLNQSSNTNIHDIFRKCQPDLTKGIIKTGNFIADDDGWVYCILDGYWGGAQIAVNGSEVGHCAFSTTTNLYIGQSFYVSRGDAITFGQIAHVVSITFYPLKGV